MAKYTFETSYKKNTDLVISVAEFKKKFLWGLDLAKYGNDMPDHVYENMIQAAQDKIEEYLQIKLFEQLYHEDKSFWNEDWKNWGYIPTQFPVKCPIEVAGWLGTIRQTLYPREWLSAKKTSDGQYLHRMLYLVPNVNSTYNQVIVFSGMLPNINYMANRQIPNYWRISYVTGFERGKIPSTILQVIGKIAAIDILTIASDGMSFAPGVGSVSISLDGLSQNLSSVMSGKNGIFGPRVSQYSQDLFGDGKVEGELKRLRQNYTDVIFGVA